MLHLSKQAPDVNDNNNTNDNNNNNNDKNNDIKRTSIFQNANILELGTHWRFNYTIPVIIFFSFPFLKRSIQYGLYNTLGAGIGLCGILLASLQTARSVVLTDYQDVVLSILEDNIEGNSQLCKFPLSI